MKKKRDMLFEEDMKSLLKPLLEQWPKEPLGTGTTSGISPVAPEKNVAATAVAPTKPATAEVAAPPVAASTETPEKTLPEQKNIVFLSTKDMFTSAPPAHSADWPAEMREKTWMIPLQDGRLVQSVLKLFPTLTLDRKSYADAARYNDYQYRVVLDGDLRAEIAIEVKASKDKPDIAVITLKSIKIPNNGKNLSPTGTKEDFLIPKNNAIEIKANTDELMKWALGEEPQLDLKSIRDKVEDLMSDTYDKFKEEIEGMPEKDSSELTDVVNDIADEVYNKNVDNTEDAISVALYKKLNKSNKPTSTKEPEKAESVDLSRYLKRILLEAKPEILKSEEGGGILSVLSNNMFTGWFRKKVGISAPTSKRLFEGNVYEWFATSKATFTPKKKTGKTDKKGGVTLSMSGELLMQAEIWIDARCGEKGAGLNRWNFYVWDTTQPIATTKYTIPKLQQRFKTAKQPELTTKGI